MAYTSYLSKFHTLILEYYLFYRDSDALSVSYLGFRITPLFLLVDLFDDIVDGGMMRTYTRFCFMIVSGTALFGLHSVVHTSKLFDTSILV